MYIGIIGFGGFAREIGSTLKHRYSYFISHDKYNKNLGNNVFSIKDLNYDKYKILIAIGDSIVRKTILNELSPSAKFYTYIHPSVKLLDKKKIDISEGSIICCNSILTTNIKIGKHSILNLNTTIGHDTRIGDFFTSAPNVNISGNCKIGNFVQFGTNSCVKEKITIVDNVIIGMNSGIVKNISESGVYIQNGIKIK